MKSFNFKPLILILPVLAVFLGFLLIDQSVSKEQPEQQSAEPEPKETVLHLVTGQAGSLQNDIGEPIYAEADTNSEKLADLQYNCCVLEAEADAPEGWIAVELTETEEAAYVREENVQRETLRIADDGSTGGEMALEALEHLGTRFEVGGTSLDEGIDCSNFVQQIYRSQGIAISDRPNDIRDEGEEITRDEARAGDVLYYDVNDGGGHVAIYLGDDFQISSMGHSGREYPEGGVRICKTVYRDREEPQFYRIAGGSDE